MSFSAEINDFVNGMKAGAAIGGDIQDRKLLREKFEFDKAFKEGSAARADRALDIRERGLSLRGANAASKAADKEAVKANKAQVKDYNEVARSAGNGSTSNDTSDFDTEFPEGDPAADESWEDSAIPVEEVTGETVRLANDGGLMEEEEPAEGKGDSELAEAIPEAIPAKQDAPIAPAPAEGKADPIYKEAASVTKDVMDTMESELSEGKADKEEAITTKPAKSQDRIADLAPASPDEMKAMWAKIDPNGELDAQQRGAKTLVDAYKFFMQKGDAVKARKIAGQIIKFNQMATMTQGQLALEALRAGDLTSASRLITDAANENIPDGVTVSAEPKPTGTVLYKIDRAGYAQQQGELGARQMWELATGVANGSMFIKRMAALAGEAKPAADEPVVTSGGKKVKRNYSDAVMAAAKARKTYDLIQSRLDAAIKQDGTDAESVKALQSQLDAAGTAYEEAYATAQRGAKALKKEKTFGNDFRNALQAALPGSGIPTGGPKPMDPETLANAKAAIAEGRSREGVLKKLQDAGYSTEGL